MHIIKGTCVNVVKEKTRGKDGNEGKDFQVLQIIRNGAFIHRIKGVVQQVREVTDHGVVMNGIMIMTNGGRYMRIEKILDEDLDKKYTPGKEIEVNAVPDIRNKGGRPEVFFKVIDPDEENDLGQIHLKSVKDWTNGKWPLNKELNLNVRFRPFLGERYSDLDYAIQEGN